MWLFVEVIIPKCIKIQWNYSRNKSIYSDIHVFELFLICAFCHSISLEGGDEVISTWDEAFESFDGMGLHENLLRGIYAYGKTPIAFRLSTFEQHRAVVIKHSKCFF